MEEQPLTDALLRQFLLGKVDEEQRQQIESLFITDPETKERILIAEQELIDDYLDDRLTVQDREIFLRQYGHTPDQKRRLRIARSINDWIDTTTEKNATSPTLSTWSRLRERFRLKPVFVIPVAVSAMILIVVTALWLNSRNEQQKRQIQVTIARLNDPSRQHEVPSPMQSLVLSPISPRSVDSRNELQKQADLQVVELRLTWIQPQRYPKYQAIVRHTDNESAFTIDDLKLEDDGAVRMRLPAHILTRGLYEIHLTGLTTEGRPGSTEDYLLTVRE